MSYQEILLPPLWGGVSRQAPNQRHPNQVQDAQDALFSVVNGFSKRPGSVHLKAIDRLFTLATATWTASSKTLTQTGAFTSYTFTSGDVVFISGGTGAAKGVYAIASKTDNDNIVLIDSIASGDLATGDITSGLTAGRDYRVHMIERDAGERYMVISGLDTLRVFDISDGSEAVATWNTRLTSAAESYFDGTAALDLGMVTVADNTIIYNRTVSLDTRDGLNPVDAGNFSDYEAMLNGSTSAGNYYKTLAPSNARTEGLWYKPGSDYVDQNGFTIDPDSNGFVRVPPKRPGDGIQPDAEIDATTAPIRMSRTSLSPLTFEVDLIPWKFRITGDSETNKPTTLFDDEHKVADITFHRNRLALGGDEHVNFSQSGDVFNFYKEDALNIVDSDPVDVQMSSKGVTLIDSFAEFRKTIVVMTKSARQFELDAPVLKPGGTDLSPSTSYHSILGVRAQSMGHQLYFPSSTQETGVVYEYTFDEVVSTNIADDITKHVFRYLPPDIKSLSVSPNNSVVVVVNQDDSELFLYRAHWVGSNKVQSAWVKYTQDSTDRIVGAGIIRDDLYMLIESPSGYVIDRLSIPEEVPQITSGTWYGDLIEGLQVSSYTAISDGEFRVTIDGVTADVTGLDFTSDATLTDVASTIQTGIQSAFAGLPLCRVQGERFVVTSATTGINSTVASVIAVPSGVGTDLATAALMGAAGVAYPPTMPYNPRIDRKIEVAGTYSSSTNLTTWDYGLDDPTLTDVVLGRDFGAMAGARLATTRVNNQSLSTPGDFSHGPALIGRPFSMDVTISEIFIRSRSGDAIIEGRLQLLKAKVLHENSGGYKFVIDQPGRATKEVEFITTQVGVSEIGALNVTQSGSLDATIMGNARDVTLRIVNDTPLPSTITGIELTGDFERRTRR